MHAYQFFSPLRNNEKLNFNRIQLKILKIPNTSASNGGVRKIHFDRLLQLKCLATEPLAVPSLKNYPNPNPNYTMTFRSPINGIISAIKTHYKFKRVLGYSFEALEEQLLPKKELGNI